MSEISSIRANPLPSFVNALLRSLTPDTAGNNDKNGDKISENGHKIRHFH